MWGVPPTANLYMARGARRPRTCARRSRTAALGQPYGLRSKACAPLGPSGPDRAASEPGKAALLWQSSLWVRLVTLTRLPLPDPVLTPNPHPDPNPNPNPRLSLPDLVLAAKIDAIEVECSPKWLKEQAAAAAAAH